VSLALYRKHRPATFAEVVGQEHVTAPLARALESGRTAHAYLFSGPRGCGKTSSARILARSLNCEQGPTAAPCGVCDSCVSLRPEGPGSLDVIEIDAASHGGVDDARDLRERAFFAPVSSRYKVYVIDEAHMVSKEGFNALLKLVEEPPEFLKFVFATTEPEKVIGTIRSRTHHYPFRLVPPAVLRDHLARICAAEGVAVEPAVLPLVVRAGAGSVRDALSVLDQLIAGSGPEGLTAAGAVALLGYTEGALLDEVVDAVAAADGAALYEAVDRAVEGGTDPRRLATDLLERFRDLVVLSAVPGASDKGLLDGCPPDQLSRMTAQAARMGQAELSRAADLLHAGLVEMRGTTSPRLLLELVCARILLPAAVSDESSVLARLDRLERRMAIAGEAAPTGTAGMPPPATVPTPEPRPLDPPAPPPAAARSVDAQPAPAPPAPALPDLAVQADPQAGETPLALAAADLTPPSGAPAAPGALDAAAVRRVWPEVLEAVKSRQRVAWMMLSSGVSVRTVAGRTLTLAFDNANNVKGFTNGGRDLVLQEALREVLGVDWDVVAVSSAAPGPAAAGRRAPSPTAPAPAREPSPAAVEESRDDDAPDGDAPEEAPDDSADDDPGAPLVSGEDAALALVQQGLGGRVIGGTDAG
jgi:DNA polymerase III subunit gamma/tau